MTATTRAHSHWRARSRLGAAVLAAILVLALAPSIGAVPVRIVVAFDAAACVFLVLTWHMILGTTADEAQRRAESDDPGRRVVFAVVLASGAAVVVGGLLLLRGSAAVGEEVAEALLGVTVSAAFLAWTVTHTVFALHYAHLYYTNETGAGPALIFPGSEDPDDLDFAYVSFTVGMTFQVSDVQVASRKVRRAVLWQSMLSFLYNTVIVALVLNLILAQLQTGRG